MLYPQTGRRLREMWETPYQSSWTKFMGKGRFLQICTALHFNDNEDEDGLKSDSLHKIRPLYNIVKKTLGAYMNLGSEHSFDEATMACHSSYGRHLIVFNGMKNVGKFHFKMYMMCCAVTYLTHNIKIHTRRAEEEEINDQEQLGVEVSKIDSITLDMCKPLFNTGATVNMDNYYTSVKSALKLKENGVFCRGTIRSSRKFVPKSILFTSSEVKQLPRGTNRCVVNESHNILAVGWIDNKAVHFISTADTTDTSTVLHRIKDKKVEVPAPIAVKMYNKYMGGVDRHDQLRTLFALGKKLKFRKYYVKLFLFLFDVGMTNAWIHYSECHPEVKDMYGTRSDFYQSVAEEMVNPNMDWNAIYGGENNTTAPTNNTVLDDNLELPRYTFPTETCMPIHLKNLQIPLSTKIKVCQICHYEMRPYRWKSVMLCSKHGVRLCSDIRDSRENCKHKLVKKDGSDVTDWSWTDRSNRSCWAKFHDFYLPQGLFNSHFHVDVQAKKCKFAQFKYTSELYQRKYNALGIEIQRKRGKDTGVGKINWKEHLTNEGNESSSENSEVSNSSSSS